MTGIVNSTKGPSHQCSGLWWVAATLFGSVTDTWADPSIRAAGQRHTHTQRLFRALAGHIGQPGPEHYNFDPKKNGGIVEKVTLQDFQIPGPSPNSPPNLALISDRLTSYEPSFGDVS